MDFSKLLRSAIRKDGWISCLYVVMGILLILFPVEFTAAIPYMLGLGLIARGLIRLAAVYKYRRTASVKVGWIIIDIVLGCAILYHNADAIGAIGAIWAMISLYEAAEEITKSYENRSFSARGMFFTVTTVVLAIMLMFDPFQHFAFHVRILGMEMISSVLIRMHTLFPNRS